MKENKKKAAIVVQEDGHSIEPLGYNEKKSTSERLIKPLIFTLMGIVFIGCMFLIFQPSSPKQEVENIGLNDSVPQPSETRLQADKQKAYEQEILEEKEQQKRNALTTLADYWNQDSEAEDQSAIAADDQGQVSNTAKSGSPAVNSYRSAQSTLGSFYQNDNGETQQLRRQLEELKEQLAEKEVPAGVSASDQLALMEKSYQMAAKYLPLGANTTDTSKNSTATAAPMAPTANFAAFTPAVKGKVSALYQGTDAITIADNWSKNENPSFYSMDSEKPGAQPKNSVKACIHGTQTIIGQSSVLLRLLEPARISNHTIAAGTIITATAKIQPGRVELKVSSIAVQASIIAVEIIIYDLDGQPGLLVPYAAEMNALTEMAGNMSQQTGTSLMMTQSATQQIAADLSRGVVQGVSGYFSKKVKAPKVTLKAGHQVLLVSKK